MIYRFAEFELDSVAGSLSTKSGPVALRDQGVRVLELLVRRAPEVLSQEEILQEVWGHSERSDSSIPQIVGEIRLALGDSARNPKFIANRYGRGYCFVGTVTGAGSEVQVRSSRRSALPLLAAVAACVAVVALAWLQFGGGKSVVADAEWVIQTAEDDPGELSGPLAEYLSFVVSSAVGSDRIVSPGLAQGRTDINRISVGLAVSDQGSSRAFELSLEGLTGAEQTVRQTYQQADELLGQSIEQIFTTIKVPEGVEVEAGLVPRSSYAVETLLRGMAAQFAGEHRRAISLFEAALEEDPAFEFARYELALVLRREGDYERSLAQLQALDRKYDSEFWTLRLANAQGTALWRLGRLEEAAEQYERAVALTTSPFGVGMITTNIALVYRDQGKLAEAEMFAGKAVESVRRAAPRDSKTRLLASTLNTQASIFMRTGKLDLAEVALKEAQELFYETGDRRAYANVTSRQSKVLSRLGRPSEAAALLALVVDIRSSLDDQLGVASSQLDLAAVNRLLGAFDGARKLIMDSLDTAQSRNETRLVFQANLSLADLALAEGKAQSATDFANRSLALAQARADEGLELAARLRLGRARLNQNDIEGLLAEADALVALANSGGNSNAVLRARLFRARVLARDQQSVLAMDVLGQVQSEAASQRERSIEVEALTRLAELSLDSDNSAALTYVEAAEALSLQPYPLLKHKARALAGLGRHTDALATALEARSRSGQWWNAQDEQLLASLEALVASVDP